MTAAIVTVARGGDKPSSLMNIWAKVRTVDDLLAVARLATRSDSLLRRPVGDAHPLVHELLISGGSPWRRQPGRGHGPHSGPSELSWGAA